MKILNVVLIGLFLFCAALQYNDPDPYVWIPIYLYGAYICFQALRKKYNFALYAAGLIVYTTYATYLFFDQDGVLSWYSDHSAEDLAQTMKATKPWIEETREFFGLVILSVSLVINLFWLKKSGKKKAVKKLEATTAA